MARKATRTDAPRKELLSHFSGVAFGWDVASGLRRVN
jgi:hypothetical protein